MRSGYASEKNVGQQATAGLDRRKSMGNYSYMTKRPTLSELLRAELAAAESLNAVQRATGIKRQSLATFLRGETTLRLDSADVLARYFGIESRRTRRRKGKG